MSQVPAWFERKFEFTFPAEQYPNICVRLRSTPARLKEMLRGVPRNILCGKPGSGWSAQEHAGHLLDLEPLWSARVDDFLTGGDTLTAADLSNRKTHEANHNALELEEILREFRAARFALADRLEKLTLLCLCGRCCIRVSSSPCGWWTIFISSPNMMIIIWQRFGSLNQRSGR